MTTRQRIVEQMQKARDAYTLAAAYCDDVVRGRRTPTPETLDGVKGSVYRCESDGQRAVDDARAIASGDK